MAGFVFHFTNVFNFGHTNMNMAIPTFDAHPIVASESPGCWGWVQQPLRRTAPEEGHRSANSFGRRWGSSEPKEKPQGLKLPTKQEQPDGMGNY